MGGRLKVEDVPVDGVIVPAGRRTIDQATVAELVKSMREIGLKTPIAVRTIRDYVTDDGEVLDEAPLLIAGAHRLAAAKALEWEWIDCIYVEDEREARLWEIAENLHRAELTVLDRSNMIAEWVALVEGGNVQTAQLAPNEGAASKRRDRRGHRREGGANAASRELGIDRTEVQRATKIAGIAPEAKKAAQEAGLSDNQSALLKVAAAPKERQVERVREVVAERHQRRTHAPDSLTDIETKEKWMAYMMAGWNRAHQEWRDEFKERIEGVVFNSTRSAA